MDWPRSSLGAPARLSANTGIVPAPAAPGSLQSDSTAGQHAMLGFRAAAGARTGRADWSPINLVASVLGNG
jgi:hypothetical protein